MLTLMLIFASYTFSTRLFPQYFDLHLYCQFHFMLLCWSCFWNDVIWVLLYKLIDYSLVLGVYYRLRKSDAFCKACKNIIALIEKLVLPRHSLKSISRCWLASSSFLVVISLLFPLLPHITGNQTRCCLLYRCLFMTEHIHDCGELRSKRVEWKWINLFCWGERWIWKSRNISVRCGVLLSLRSLYRQRPLSHQSLPYRCSTLLSPTSRVTSQLKPISAKLQLSSCDDNLSNRYNLFARSVHIIGLDEEWDEACIELSSILKFRNVWNVQHFEMK